VILVSAGMVSMALVEEGHSGKAEDGSSFSMFSIVEGVSITSDENEVKWRASL
jgi:hypothetical protein